MKLKKVMALSLAMGLAAALSAPVLAAAPEGFTAYYSFDGSLDGLAATGALAADEGGNITFAEGVAGEAAVFDGASGINLGADVIKSFTYTVAAWVNPSALTMHTPIFFGAPDQEHFVSFLPFSWSEKYGVWMHNAGSTPEWADLFGTSALDLNTWTHVAFTVDNGKFTVYKDGEVFYNNDTGALDILSNGGSFFLGVNYWDAAFAGMIDEFYAYDGKALSTEEIAALMTADEAPAEEAPAEEATAEEAPAEEATEEAPAEETAEEETPAEETTAEAPAGTAAEETEAADDETAADGEAMPEAEAAAEVNPKTGENSYAPAAAVVALAVSGAGMLLLKRKSASHSGK